MVFVDEDSRIGYWTQFDSPQSTGDPGVSFDRLFGDKAWTAFTDSGAQYSGLAMHIDELVPCGVPFASFSPSATTIYSGQSDYLSIDVTGTGVGFLCLDTNDPLNPILVVPVISQ